MGLNLVQRLNLRERQIGIDRPDGLLQLAGLYLGGQNPRTPLAAPLYADLSGLPALLIQVGTWETLPDDASRIAEGLFASHLAIPRSENLTALLFGNRTANGRSCPYSQRGLTPSRRAASSAVSSLSGSSGGW